ncbi:MAG: hypothetical protein WCR42_04700 [bacterium]
MYTTYQVNSNDLTMDFVEILKKTYQDKEIEITVSEIDETEYLLRSPKNRKVLLKRIHDINEGVNIISPKLDAFDENNIIS